VVQEKRIALIHATRLAIDPIETAAQKKWPEAEVISILEEGLSIDRAKSKSLVPDLKNRIVRLARYAEDIGAHGILYTCSAFGEGIEEAALKSKIPVLKPNEAMFKAAISHGDRAAMIYTFPPSAGGMEEEFREEALRCGSSTVLTTVFCDDALEAKRSGDHDHHDHLIAQTAAGIGDADVIMLAQFSMASAAALARTKTDIPILTSPDEAIAEIRQRVNVMGKVASTTP